MHMFIETWDVCDDCEWIFCSHIYPLYNNKKTKTNTIKPKLNIFKQSELNWNKQTHSGNWLKLNWMWKNTKLKLWFMYDLF